MILKQNNSEKGFFVGFTRKDTYAGLKPLGILFLVPIFKFLWLIIVVYVYKYSGFRHKTSEIWFADAWLEIIA